MAAGGAGGAVRQPLRSGRPSFMAPLDWTSTRRIDSKPNSTSGRCAPTQPSSTLHNHIFLQVTAARYLYALLAEHNARYIYTHASPMRMAGLGDRQARGSGGQVGLQRGRWRQSLLWEVGFYVAERSSEDRGGPQHARRDRGGDREGKGGCFCGTDCDSRAYAIRWRLKLSQGLCVVVK